MSRRHKYLDRHKPNVPPTVSKRRRGDGWRDRHERRLRTNLNYEATFAAWCAMHKITLGIFNKGHHWKMTLVDGRIVEWWPSSAKLVFFKKYQDGWHVHDYLQVMHVMSEKLGLKADQNPEAQVAA